MIVMFLHEVCRCAAAVLGAALFTTLSDDIKYYKFRRTPQRNGTPAVLRILRFESHRPRHAVGLSGNGPSQLVLAAVRPLLARSVRPMPEGNPHLPFFINPASRKKTAFGALD